MKANIGLISGIIGEELKRDYWGTLAHVAEIGYRGIEGAREVGGDIRETKRRLDDLGLKAITVSASRDKLAGGLDALIADAQALEALHISIWWGPCDDREKLLRDGNKTARLGSF